MIRNLIKKRVVSICLFYCSLKRSTECGLILSEYQNEWWRNTPAFLPIHKLIYCIVTYMNFWLCFQCSWNDLSHQKEESAVTFGQQVSTTTACRCRVCHKVFATVYILKTHSKVHNIHKTFSCEECGRHFSKPSYLSIRARVHTGERPYVCRECGKGFSVYPNLKIHYQIHTREKPYTCNYCCKEFRVLHTLKMHIRTHTGEKIILL